jgi:hypothetical protein
VDFLGVVDVARVDLTYNYLWYLNLLRAFRVPEKSNSSTLFIDCPSIWASVGQSSSYIKADLKNNAEPLIRCYPIYAQGAEACLMQGRYS